MINIDDLEQNEDLDRKAMQDLFGGGSAIRTQSGLRISAFPTVQRETQKTDFGLVVGSSLDPTGFGRIAAPFVPGSSVISTAIGLPPAGGNLLDD